MDVEDHEDTVVVTADHPGFGKDDRDVYVTDARLSIRSGRESEEAREEADRRVREERHHRSVRRSVDLPVPVDRDVVSMRYDNGVLPVTPGKSSARGRSVEVESARVPEPRHRRVLSGHPVSRGLPRGRSRGERASRPARLRGRRRGVNHGPPHIRFGR